MSKFRASVQYGDWEGTAAADVADQRSVEALLEKKGSLDLETEFLAAIEFNIVENTHAVVDRAYIHALIGRRPAGTDWGAKIKEDRNPLRVRRVEVDLSIGEFLGLFKRFAVTLSRRGLGLIDHEYEEEPD